MRNLILWSGEIEVPCVEIWMAGMAGKRTSKIVEWVMYVRGL